MSDALSLAFHALSDPTRRQILARLARGEATVQELTDPLPISQPAVSKHLMVLERAGMVVRRRATPRRYARLQGRPFQDALAYLTEFQRQWDESFARLDAVLEEEKAKAQAGRPGGPSTRSKGAPRTARRPRTA